MNKQDFITIMQRTQKPLTNMVEMIPEDKLDWAPDEGFMTTGQLINHLTENWSVVKMMVNADFPFTEEGLADALKLENMKSMSKTDALAAMDKDLNDAIAYITDEISDDDFFGKVVSAPWGFKGEIWQAVGMANDHQIGHKMQLHLYLKLMGQPVHTGTLYGM